MVNIGEVEQEGLTPEALGGDGSSQKSPEIPRELSKEDGNQRRKPSTAEAVLLEAMRNFVRATVHPSEENDKEEPPFKFWHLLNLLAIALDAALFFLLVPEWFEHPIVSLSMKVLPWLLGATAVTYYTKHVRDVILAIARRKWMAFLAVIVGFPLLILWQPVFSVLVSTDADSVTLDPVDKTDKLEISQIDNRTFRIRVPSLTKPYRVAVLDKTMEKADTGTLSRSFSPLIGKMQILKGTLAQVPLLIDIPFGSRLIGQRQIAVTPLYQVNTNVPVQPETANQQAHAIVSGKFEEGYLEFLSYNPDKQCKPYPEEGASAIWCALDSGDGSIFLPSGNYLFTIQWAQCNKGPFPESIQRDNKDVIDVGQLCGK
jgi:hypothetical protein